MNQPANPYTPPEAPLGDVGDQEASQPSGWRFYRPGQLRFVVTQHWELYLILALYLAGGYILDACYPGIQVVKLGVYNDVLLLLVFTYLTFCGAGLALSAMLTADRNQSLLRQVFARLARFFTFERLVPFLAVFAFIHVFSDVFMSYKAMIPRLHPFDWDQTLMHWDRAVHLGRHPWQWLQPLATPLFTFIVNCFYNLWMFVMFGVLFWQAWSTNWRLRRRYLICFGLCWILIGTALAIALASAGPCYYARVTGETNDPYAAQMKYLYDVNDHHYPVFALDVQEKLWNGYAADFLGVEPKDLPEGKQAGDRLFKGISAMPSLHVSIATLMALVGWYTRRWLGVVLGLFALSIEIGSFHLAWHYAIDGYVSAVLTVILWYAVGWYLRWREGPEEPPHEAAPAG